MSQTVEVRFKGTRKAYFLWEDEADPLHIKDSVIVEVERGRDLGRVTAVGDMAAKKCGSCTSCAVGESGAETGPLKPVVRRATPEDCKSHQTLRLSEEEVRQKVIQRARAHELLMKISDTEWQWDRNKLTIYFTADKRVDFRALVRDLASLFRTRIELRQIGVRDEAARLSGKRPGSPGWAGAAGSIAAPPGSRSCLRSIWVWPRTSTSRSIPPRSPADAADSYVASSTSTSSTSPPGSAFPRRARH
jgi:cell fate regulator YaaT (PSP1 superfamily)